MTPRRLRQIIKQIAPSQAQFARALNVPDRQVRRWLSGKRDIPEDIAITIELLIGDRTPDQVLAKLEKRVATVRLALDPPSQVAA